MLALERKNRILEKLHANGRVYVGELAREFAVSEETIRRDLEKLDKEGIATKSYGGAVFNESAGIDLPFNVRQKHNVAGKQRIAAQATELISDGDHLFLDASSTAVYIAKAIKEKKNLTVITNSIEILIELSDVSDWNIISSGGQLREGYLALMGAGAISRLSDFQVEKAFVSYKALSLENGIMEGNEEIALTKQVMMDHAVKTYLTADSSKFGKYALSRVCALNRVSGIITDERPSDAWTDYFERNGMELYCP